VTGVVAGAAALRQLMTVQLLEATRQVLEMVRGTSRSIEMNHEHRHHEDRGDPPHGVPPIE
jgi:hypothetical protein